MSSKTLTLTGAIIVLLIIIVPIAYFAPKGEAIVDTPWAHMPQHPVHTDHSNLLKGPFKSGQEVTEACLQCHPQAANQVMHTSHWTWENGPYDLPGHDQPVYGGKKHLINNFCIGITGNWPPCTACHIGYGWKDNTFDFSNQKNVDCLVCHDTSGAYVKKNTGEPADSVDLTAVAQSVGIPNRENCGTCHFKGGGGDAVKHGDLDNSLIHPSASLDVHMGKYNFSCTDCHRTEDHQIQGRSISVSMDDANQVHCTDCHSNKPHQDARLNDHTDTVACQTCHIPEFARKEATKMQWDWSQAGQDIPQDPHEYLKIKGRFVYEKDVIPTYAWYNGTADRYILGDKIDPTQETVLNMPHGSINDPAAKIFPFKVHHAKQIYDKQYDYLIPPKTFGEGGYWTDFDWDEAARLGTEANGMAYSGEYGFARTAMYWPTTHMVAPKENALQCEDCHTPNGTTGRLDWKALGYDGDPMFYGGREQRLKTAEAEAGGAQ